LQQLAAAGATTLGVRAEPAPYAVPPVDLWHWQVWLDRSNRHADFDVTIAAVDHHSRGKMNWVRPRLLPTPIGWAGKPWDVSVADRFLPGDQRD
jgi:hypothetical protein